MRQLAARVSKSSIIFMKTNDMTKKCICLADLKTNMAGRKIATDGI